MTMHLGNVDSGSILYIPFATYAGSTGASATLTGLAVTDIEIYKNGSTTQRASDAGYALLDTDGIDFDSITGIHGFSVDLSDDTDAGFYSAGAFYWVVVSAVTVDSQTVNFIAATFRIGPAAANVTQFGGTAGTFSSGRPEVNATQFAGQTITAAAGVTLPSSVASPTNITAGTITTVTNLTNAPTAGDFTATMKTSIGTAVAASAVASVTGNVGGNVAGSVASVTAGVTVTTNNDKTGYAVGVGGIESTSFAAGAIDAAAIAANAIGASELAQDAAQEIADEVLNRDLVGGASGDTRNVRNALRSLRNKAAIVAGTLTVYQEDDTTSAWTAAVTTAAGDPIDSIDPS